MAAFSKTLQAAIVPWLGLARFSLLLRSPLRLQNPPRVTVMVAVAVMVVVTGSWELGVCVVIVHVRNIARHCFVGRANSDVIE